MEKKIEPNMSKIKSLKYNVVYVLKLVLNYKKRYLVGLVVLTIINAILPFISIINVQIIINTVQMKLPFEILVNSITIFVVINILMIICANLYSYLLSVYSDYLYLVLNNKLLDETNKFNFKDFENTVIYNVIQRAEEEIGVRPISLITSILSMLSGFITLISSLVILLSWNSKIVILFLLLPIFAIFYFMKISKYEYNIKFNRTTYERKSWYIAHLLTKDTYIKEVKMLRLFDYLITEFKKLRLKFHLQNKKIAQKKSFFTFIYNMMNNFIALFIVLKAILDTYKGALLVGNLMTVINTSSKVENAIKSLVNTMFNIYQDGLFCSNIVTFFQLKHESFEGNSKIHITSINSIEIINLSYKYHGRQEYALKNVSMKLSKGDRVAIVGENGSGKSTLIKILCKLYDDYEGEILVNGISLKDINMINYGLLISTVFQDYNQYQFTVQENIGFGDVERLDEIEIVQEASKLSGAAEFIENLPNKYDQQVGLWFENGTQLSGGQWQKLAISRAFMKNAELFIFDEPTASLDPSAEFEFFKNYSSKIQEKIGIFVTHRFTNAKFTNKIIVMHKGEIVANGTHEELMKSNLEYKKMYDFQNTVM